MATQYYLHSSHDLDALVSSVVKHNLHLFGRNIRLRVAGQSVIITGRVDSYFQKQMAQESFRGLLPLDRLQNDLKVA